MEPERNEKGVRKEMFRDRKLGQLGNLEAERSRDSGQDGRKEEKKRLAHVRMCYCGACMKPWTTWCGCYVYA